tara:strand:- start:380 stop:1372 length:993 start_codon:yes stop_codon:yes gene_type:complete
MAGFCFAPMVVLAQGITQSEDEIKQSVIDSVKKEFDGAMRDDPSLTIKTENIDYDVKHEILTVTGMEAVSTSTTDPFRVIVDRVQSVHPSVLANKPLDEIFIPKNGFVSIEGMKIDVDYLLASMKNDPNQVYTESDLAESKAYLDYFKGDDAFVRIDLRSDVNGDESQGLTSLSVVDVENVGTINVNANVGGIYALNGSSLTDQNLPMLAMGSLSLDSLTFGFTSSGLSEFVDLYLSQENKSKSELLSDIQSELDKVSAKGTQLYKDEVTTKLYSALYESINGGKEFNVSFSIKNINMGTVMALMSQQSEQQQSKFMRDTLQLDVKASAL